MRESNYVKMITCDFSKFTPLQQELVAEHIGEYRKTKEAEAEALVARIWTSYVCWVKL